jgi:tellurite resistance protein TehA-like permease
MRLQLRFVCRILLTRLTTNRARYTIWPKMLPLMLYHPSQALFLGTFAMGFATIVNMCALSLAPAWGFKFAIFTWVLWWIDSVISVVICIGLPFLQFTRHTQSLDQITGIWLLPVVSPIVSAASGGIVAGILPPSHARLTIIVSYIQWGMGFGLAFMILALYYARLAIYKIPPATIIVSAFLPLGPCGQGAFGLLQLSSALYNLSKEGQGGLTANSEDANIIATAIYGISIPIALCLWGLGLAWLVLAVSSLFDLWLVSNLKFNLGWWGFTFPLGVFCTATTQFGKELDSTGFKVLGTVLSVLEIILWLFIAFMTFIEALRGKM